MAGVQSATDWEGGSATMFLALAFHQSTGLSLPGIAGGRPAASCECERDVGFPR